MRFHWNDANIKHIARHHVTPEETEQALDNDPFEVNYEIIEGEERWTSLGHTDRLRILKIVWTLRGETVRVVTAVDASKSEIYEYLKGKAPGSGEER